MTEKAYADAKWLWLHGSTIEVIAQMVGYSKGTIKHVARSNRQDFPPRKRRLTDDERERIHELRSIGWTQERIAKAVRRPRSMIQRVLSEAAQ